MVRGVGVGRGFVNWSAPVLASPPTRKCVHVFWREMASARRSYRLDSTEIVEFLIDDDDSDVGEAPNNEIEGKLLFQLMYSQHKLIFVEHDFILFFCLFRITS